MRSAKTEVGRDAEGLRRCAGQRTTQGLFEVEKPDSTPTPTAADTATLFIPTHSPAGLAGLAER